MSYGRAPPRIGAMTVTQTFTAWTWSDRTRRLVAAAEQRVILEAARKEA
jgi:hypothetical protein